MSAPNWITPAGLAGVYPALISMELQLVATPGAPATSITYTLISGELPAGLSFRVDGLISGTPSIVTGDTTSTFVVRATDNLGNLKDRTFSLRISGDALPSFTTPDGSLTTTFDSVWIEIPIEYNNPLSDNPVNIRVLQGALPPGLEINEFGLIRGYPEPPITVRNLPEVTTIATSTDASNNNVTVLGTSNFVINRPIVFSGTSIGGIMPDQVYYVKSIINATQLTISTVPDGDALILSTDNGFMDVTLPATSLGQPTKRQYSFTLELTSPLGNDNGFYSITVINQNLPTNQGGPGYASGTRTPTIYNTRPPTYDIENTANFGYYVLPPVEDVSVPGTTYATTANAYIGQILSNNYFTFRMIGHDFDSSEIAYAFIDLPFGLTGNTTTGWIYGTPSIAANTIQEGNFSVVVSKVNNPVYQSPIFNFSLRVANNITGDIVWINDSDLGNIDNATASTIQIQAESDVDLIYELDSGTLPPNLVLKENGELDGVVAYQPTDTYQEQDETATFTFTVKAYNPDILDDSLEPLIVSTKEFTLTVVQTYDIPTDNLYIKCTPSLADRDIIATLLDNTSLIPTNYLYRPDDPNFGKANNIIYAHAYGIYSSDFEDYVEAVKKNHYWRNITLGELKTAVARNEAGDVIYEVVYSTVIDNLQKYDPNYDYDYRYSESVSEEILWPRFIDLNLGPWYASSTELYTSYIFNNESSLLTNFTLYDILSQTGVPLLMQEGEPTFYTSLTPGYARILYPNSLENMRKRVEQELGANYNFRLLPLWMTSQQNDGNTLGFTPAWVICYTKPGFANTVKQNIENNWPYTLNQINFQIDRFTVGKTMTFDYGTKLEPKVWTRYPSGTPVPDPTDSEDFYVLFPQKTILPTKTQYNL
jgi:hypothetical protein